MRYDFSALRAKMKKNEDWLSKEYLQIHTGRANASFLDGVSVESYGAKMPVKNIASINMEDAKSLRIAPWDKNQIKEIEKAIAAANLGVSVMSDSDGLRVIFPSLTEETRLGIVKLVKARLEDARITLRKEREEVWDEIQKKEKEGAMSEDEKFKAKEELQKIVDEANGSLEKLFERKEHDVMS